MHSTPRPDVRDEDGSDGARGPQPGSARGGVLAWVLVLASAVPLLLVLEASRQFFAGDLDERYFGFSSGSDLDTDRVVPFVERWYAFTYTVPTTPALLASTLGVVVVTGLVLLGRPRPLVPPTPARWLAFGVSALTTLAALLVLLAALLAVSEEPVVEGDAGSSSTPYVSFPEIINPVGVSLLTGVVSALAAGVLARRPTGPGVPHDDTEDTAAPPWTTADPAPEPTPDRVRDPAPDRVPDPAPLHLPAVGAAPPAFPRAEDSDLDLYRRP